MINTIEAIGAFDWQSQLRDAVTANLGVITQLQTEQFVEGTDINGDPITLDGEGYATSTIAHKRQYGVGLGALTDRITRFDTGALYANLQTTIDGDMFSTISTVEYWNDLLARTGDVGTGLDESRRITFAEEVVLPTVSAQWEEKTGLKW